jgi:hypothetical protein
MMRLHRIRSRDRSRDTRNGIASAFACLLVACSGCRSSNGSDDAAGETCDYASCEAYCRSVGLCYGSCAGGTCHCACGVDADADANPEDTEPDRMETSDVEAAEDAADLPDAGECTYRAPDETRPGASPGVTCRRVSFPALEYVLLNFAADGESIVVPGHIATRNVLWRLDRATRCWEELGETVSDTSAREVILGLAIEGSQVAFSTKSDAGPTASRCALQLFDLETRELRVLEENISDDPGTGGSACSMHPVALEYPWVVWRDIRQETTGFYPWDVLVFDLRSDEITNLSINPTSGARGWGSSTVRVDVRNGLAVFDADWYNPTPPPNVFMDIVSVDLPSGTRRQITAAPGEQYSAVVTEDWVAWIDLREDPTQTSFWPCSADIYGWNRTTEEEVLLVGGEDTAMHGPALDAEGPWLVYSDHRWGPWPACDSSDDEGDVVALHLPTICPPGPRFESPIGRESNGAPASTTGTTGPTASCSPRKSTTPRTPTACGTATCRSRRALGVGRLTARSAADSIRVQGDTRP